LNFSSIAASLFYFTVKEPGFIALRRLHRFSDIYIQVSHSPFRLSFI
jgi:hypothetical protein